MPPSATTLLHKRDCAPPAPPYPEKLKSATYTQNAHSLAAKLATPLGKYICAEATGVRSYVSTVPSVQVILSKFRLVIPGVIKPSLYKAIALVFNSFNTMAAKATLDLLA